MTNIEINCPECGHHIELTEQLASPLVNETKRKYEALLKGKEADLKKKEAEVEKTKKVFEEEFKYKLCAEQERIAKEEQRKAKVLAENDIREKVSEIDLLRDRIKNNDEKLAEARQKQADFMKKERELEDRARELDLQVEKKLREESKTMELKLRDNLAQEHALNVRDKDEKIDGLRRKITELQQRAEQGSMQAQGESLEVELEYRLKELFPFDNIKPVAKGESGADIIQEVMSPNGKIVGSILWETKRTKTWHASWLPKLREDQRVSGADICVLMSKTLPQEVSDFDNIDNVWVTSFESALSLAKSLRINLIEMANLRIVRDGEASKKEVLYDYLTGPNFKSRVEAIVEKFSEAQQDLLKEKKWMVKMWARREKQLEGVINSTVGMYGDLEGLAGSAMPEIEALEVPLLGEG